MFLLAIENKQRYSFKFHVVSKRHAISSKPKGAVMPSKSKQIKQMQQSTSSEAHPHNIAFQRLFSQKIIVRAFLEITLPLQLLNIIDLKTLTIEKGEFSEYMKGLCDLVVVVRLKNSHLIVKLVFNIEHQSTIRQFLFFTQNELASGHFWVASPTAHAVDQRLATSKACSF